MGRIQKMSRFKMSQLPPHPRTLRSVCTQQIVCVSQDELKAHKGWIFPTKKKETTQARVGLDTYLYFSWKKADLSF